MTTPQTSEQPTIRFSFHDHRLSISKAVLSAIGKPEHIQILISPDTTKLYIKCCPEHDINRFAVPPRVYGEGTYRFVLQKTAFAEAVRERLNWDAKGKYRMLGVSIADDVMVFKFDEAERLDGGEAL